MKKSTSGIIAKRRTSPVANVLQLYTFDPQNGTGSTTHSMVSLPTNSFLVITRQAETDGQNGTVTSSPSLIWTKRADSQGTQSGDAEIYTASFPAGGNITITSILSAFKQSSVCYVILNAETTPQGASAIGVLQAAPLLTLSTTRINSILLCVTSDWDAINGSTRTYRDSPTETQYYFSAGATTGYHYYKASPTISSHTLGLFTPSTQKSGTCILEVRGIPPGGPDLTPPTTPILSSGITTSTSITISWTASSDNIGVTGYDIFVNGIFNSTTTNTIATISSLIASTSYTFFVRAKDAAGNIADSNSVNASTTATGSFGTLIYTNGFDTQQQLDPFGHGQIGNGSLSTTIFVTGPGAFKAVPANVSSGIRSEVQFNEGGQGVGQTPVEGVYEWDVRYETIFQDNGHSFQFHPNTTGGSASPGLWHIGGKWVWVNWKSNINTQYLTNFTIPQNQWMHCILEIKFASNGYIKFTVDGNILLDRTNVQMGDGSGQYLKVGTNQWVSAPSVVYYDNLKVWQR